MERSAAVLSTLESKKPHEILNSISDFLNPGEILQDTLNKALLAACKMGNKFLVLNLLSFNININCEDDEGNTPLMICAMHGYCDIARLLLHNRANVRCINKNGDSPLILSITISGSTDMISLLLAQNNVDIFHKNSKGLTFLLKAVEHINLSTIRLICGLDQYIKFSANDMTLFVDFLHEAELYADRINIKTFRYVKQEVRGNKSSLEAAAIANDLEGVKLLVASGFLQFLQIQRYGNLFLNIIQFYKTRDTEVTSTDIEIIKLLISKIRSLKISNYLTFSLLEEAVYFGNCELLHLFCQFIDERLSIDTEWLYARGAEADFRKCRMDMINILLEHKDKLWPFCSGRDEILEEAKKYGRADLIKLFNELEKKNNMPEEGNNWSAAEKFEAKLGATNTCSTTIKKEAVQHALENALRTNSLNDASIFLCVFHHCSEVIDQSILNKALLSACDRGNMFVVQNLLSLNVDINCEDDMGNTPLLICVMNGHCDIARLLLINGANVRCINRNGDSPLILSVIKSGSKDMFELLYAQKYIEKYRKNSQGFTFLMKAVEMIDLEVMAFFCNVYRFRREYSEDDQVAMQEMFNEAQSYADEIGVKLFNYVYLSIVEYKPALVSAALQSDLQGIKILLHSNILRILTEHLMEGNIINNILDCYKQRNTGVSKKDIDIIKTLLTNSIRLSSMVLSDVVAIGSCELLDLFCEVVDQTHPNDNQKYYDNGVEEAIDKRRFDMLDILLNHKDNFWLQTEERIEILDKAFEVGAFDFIKMFFLLEEKNQYIGNCLIASVKFGQETCFDLTLETFHYEVVDIVKDAESGIFHKAVKNGNIDIINKLLNLGADINGVYWDQTPIMFCQEAESAIFLIQNGADVNVRLQRTNFNVILNLINSLNDYQRINLTTDLIKKIDSVKELIALYQKHGVNIDDTENRERTALMLVSGERYGEYLVNFLLECGADPNKCDKIGRNALFFAVVRNRIKIIEILLQCASNINAKFPGGKTCLHLSVSKSKIAILRRLLQHGADVNVQDNDGRTPLMLAAGNQEANYDVVEALLGYGANVNIKDTYGYSALSEAVDKFRPKMIVSLCTNGVDREIVDEAALKLIFNVSRPFIERVSENYILCLNYLFKTGASAAGVQLYIVYDLISQDKLDLIQICMHYGLRPQECWLYLQSFPAEFENEGFSPFCLAFLKNKTTTAQFFSDVCFLTYQDLYNSSRITAVRRFLECNQYDECLNFFNTFYSTPLSLEKLCLMTVWSVVGDHTNQEESVETLPIPKGLKNKLMFRTKNSCHEEDVNVLADQLIALERSVDFDTDSESQNANTNVSALNADIEEDFESFRINDDYLYYNQ